MAAVSKAATGMGSAAVHKGFEWFRSIGSPAFFVAPMVAHSELAYRLLCREYGAQMTVTPMIHAKCVDTRTPRTAIASEVPHARHALAGSS